jgi:hypothetical protein
LLKKAKMGINPRAYLRDAFARILAGEKSLTALLPETYATAHAERCFGYFGHLCRGHWGHATRR